MDEKPRTIQEQVLQDSVAQQIISFARICKAQGWTEKEIVGVAKDALHGMSAEVETIAKAGMEVAYPSREETQWQSPK